METNKRKSYTEIEKRRDYRKKSIIISKRSFSYLPTKKYLTTYNIKVTS